MALQVGRDTVALGPPDAIGITTQGRADAAQVALLEAVIAQLPIGVSVRASDGRLIAANEYLMQIWRGAGLPESVPDFVDWPSYHADGRPYEAEEWPIARSLRTGETVRDEAVAIDRFDGTTSVISVSSVPIRDAASTIVAAVAVVTDISEQARIAEAREAFLDMLAHELRTPLTSIYAGSVLLEKAAGTRSAIAALASDVGAEAERLRRMVEDLLVISRVERGAELRRDEPVLVRHVADRVVREEALRHPGIHVQADIPAGLPAVTGDDGYLEQILHNLISNAAKYGEAGGAIRLVAATEGDHVQLSVQDEGPGFVDSDAARAFDLFYRGPSAMRRAAGAGIGLYVVRALAEAMGGRAWARTRPGGGGEVGVTLLVAAPTS